MKYVTSLSGGAASAVAHTRAIERYGKDNVIAWFADTQWEDDDLYRFLEDLEKFWGQSIRRYTKGINPLDVADNQNIIPNQKLAPCSQVLKQKPFKKFIEWHEKPVTVLLGLDWSEQHRMVAPKKVYESIPGVSVDFPLMWKPYDFDVFQTVKSWGIEIPRLYKMGFPHNNCGGRCIRQGVSEWQRLRVHFPERFAEVRDWEAARQAIGDARQGYAICRDQSNGEVKPLSLAEIEKREVSLSESAKQEDLFACFCSY